MSEHMQCLPKSDLLTLEELADLAGIFVDRGVRRIRLTGGEPLVRRNILTLVEAIGRHLGQGLDEITMTTNGTQLAPVARRLRECGVRRINVSLDSRDTDRVRAITRRGNLDQVLGRSDEHTSELQSLMRNLVCHLLPEKINNTRLGDVQLQTAV